MQRKALIIDITDNNSSPWKPLRYSIKLCFDTNAFANYFPSLTDDEQEFLGKKIAENFYAILSEDSRKNCTILIKHVFPLFSRDNATTIRVDVKKLPAQIHYATGKYNDDRGLEMSPKSGGPQAEIQYSDYRSTLNIDLLSDIQEEISINVNWLPNTKEDLFNQHFTDSQKDVFLNAYYQNLHKKRENYLKVFRIKENLNDLNKKTSPKFEASQDYQSLDYLEIDEAKKRRITESKDENIAEMLLEFKGYHNEYLLIQYTKQLIGYTLFESAKKYLNKILDEYKETNNNQADLADSYFNPEITKLNEIFDGIARYDAEKLALEPDSVSLDTKSFEEIKIIVDNIYNKINNHKNDYEIRKILNEKINESANLFKETISSRLNGFLKEKIDPFKIQLFSVVSSSNTIFLISKKLQKIASFVDKNRQIAFKKVNSEIYDSDSFPTEEGDARLVIEEKTGSDAIPEIEPEVEKVNNPSVEIQEIINKSYKVYIKNAIEKKIMTDEEFGLQPGIIKLALDLSENNIDIIKTTIDAFFSRYKKIIDTIEKEINLETNKELKEILQERIRYLRTDITLVKNKCHDSLIEKIIKEKEELKKQADLILLKIIDFKIVSYIKKNIIDAITDAGNAINKKNTGGKPIIVNDDLINKPLNEVVESAGNLLIDYYERDNIHNSGRYQEAFAILNRACSNINLTLQPFSNSDGHVPVKRNMYVYLFPFINILDNNFNNALPELSDDAKKLENSINTISNDVTSIQKMIDNLKETIPTEMTTVVKNNEDYHDFEEDLRKLNSFVEKDHLDKIREALKKLDPLKEIYNDMDTARENLKNSGIQRIGLINVRDKTSRKDRDKINEMQNYYDTLQKCLQDINFCKEEFKKPENKPFKLQLPNDKYNDKFLKKYSTLLKEITEHRIEKLKRLNAEILVFHEKIKSTNDETLLGLTDTHNILSKHLSLFCVSYPEESLDAHKQYLRKKLETENLEINRKIYQNTGRIIQSLNAECISEENLEKIKIKFDDLKDAFDYSSRPKKGGIISSCKKNINEIKTKLYNRKRKFIKNDLCRLLGNQKETTTPFSDFYDNNKEPNARYENARTLLKEIEKINDDLRIDNLSAASFEETEKAFKKLGLFPLPDTDEYLTTILYNEQHKKAEKKINKIQRSLSQPEAIEKINSVINTSLSSTADFEKLKLDFNKLEGFHIKNMPDEMNKYAELVSKTRKNIAIADQAFKRLSNIQEFNKKLSKFIAGENGEDGFDLSERELNINIDLYDMTSPQLPDDHPIKSQYIAELKAAKTNANLIRDILIQCDAIKKINEALDDIGLSVKDFYRIKDNYKTLKKNSSLPENHSCSIRYNKQLEDGKNNINVIENRVDQLLELQGFDEILGKFIKNEIPILSLTTKQLHKAIKKYRPISTALPAGHALSLKFSSMFERAQENANIAIDVFNNFDKIKKINNQLESDNLSEEEFNKLNDEVTELDTAKFPLQPEHQLTNKYNEQIEKAKKNIQNISEKFKEFDAAFSLFDQVEKINNKLLNPDSLSTSEFNQTQDKYKKLKNVKFPSSIDPLIKTQFEEILKKAEEKIRIETLTRNTFSARHPNIMKALKIAAYILIGIGVVAVVGVVSFFTLGGADAIICIGGAGIGVALTAGYVEAVKTDETSNYTKYDEKVKTIYDTNLTDYDQFIRSSKRNLSITKNLQANKLFTYIQTKLEDFRRMKESVENENFNNNSLRVSPNRIAQLDQAAKDIGGYIKTLKELVPSADVAIMNQKPNDINYSHLLNQPPQPSFFKRHPLFKKVLDTAIDIGTNIFIAGSGIVFGLIKAITAYRTIKKFDPFGLCNVFQPAFNDAAKQMKAAAPVAKPKTPTTYMLNKNIQPLLVAEFSLFKKCETDFLEKNRGTSSDMQHLYDKRYGLTLFNKVRSTWGAEAAGPAPQKRWRTK